uniref:Uncharacterized protein n=1 Tax=viral metagenome TaxID=1070528 RepID=A0A6M3KUT4_9ZZZZ
MERLVDYKYSELISAGFDRLPPGIANRLRYTHFFTGTDPVYAGLFDYDKTDDGRSYHNEWCVAYPYHLTKLPKRLRQTTVIMPEFDKRYPVMLLPMLIVHELAHVLDGILGFDYMAEPVTQYAETDRMEAFADAFVLWQNPGYRQYYDLIRTVDDRTSSLFRELEELWKVNIQ